MNEKENIKIATEVSLVTIAVNVVLATIKFIAGFFGNSMAMLSDAVHSLSDVLSTFVVIIGVRMAKSETDKDHQYGHERYECIAGIVLAFLLIFTGLGIGFSGVEKIYAKEYLDAKLPTSFALYAAIISLLIKEGMYWYTRKAAVKINSDVLMADAWHHRSDALSSIGSFIGILGAQHGLPILDPLASILICFFILKVGYEVFISSIDKVMDKACDEETMQEIREHILAQEGVKAIDLLKTRLFGQRIFVDVEIAVDKNLNIVEAHSIAEKVHDSLEKNFQAVKHCMVHVNPYLL